MAVCQVIQTALFIIQQAMKYYSKVSPVTHVGEGVLRAVVAPESSNRQVCAWKGSMDTLQATCRTHCYRRW